MHSNNTPVFTVISNCPWCQALLRLRYRRHDQAPFLGCSAYPSCTFTAPYDEALNELGRRLYAAEARVHVPALSPQELDKDLKKLLAVVHPDRWRDDPLATELSKAVNDLRAKIKS